MDNDQTKTGAIGKSSVTIGRFTYGFESSIVKQWNEGAALNIGNFCSIAKNVTFMLGGNHRIDWMTTYPFGHIFQQELLNDPIIGHPSTNGDINIGNDVWIGSDVTILSGIEIGNGAVIGTKSLVTKDVQPYEVVGGNPAKHIKFRFHPSIIAELQKINWWNLEIEIIKKIALYLCQVPDKNILDQVRLIINSNSDS